MEHMISGRTPPPSLMRMLQEGEWTSLREGLHNGLSPNAAWPGHGTLFEMFVVASSIKRHAHGSAIQQQQMDALHAFQAAGLSPTTPFNTPLPLSISLLMGRDDYVLALLQAGHDANGLGAHGQTPLTIFASRGLAAQALQIFPTHRAKTALQHLFDHGCDVNLPGELGWRPAQLAVVGHDIELLHILLGRDANPNLTHGQLDDQPFPQAAHTALALALGHGKPESIGALVEAGATWDCAAALGFSAVEAAGRHRAADVWFEVVRRLGCAHPDVVRGWWQAAAADNMGLIQWFISTGFDAQAQDEQGWNALHHAAHHGKIATCKILVEAGLDPNLPTKGHGTARDLLAPHGQQLMADMGWRTRIHLVPPQEGVP